MARKIYLTENQLNKVVKKLVKEEEMKEGIFDGISNVFQGLKGVWRGEGYDFFRYLNQLKNLVGNMKKHAQAIEKLNDLKSKITGSKMSGEKKGLLVAEIDKLILAYQRYSQELSRVEQEVNDRLAGRQKPIIDQGGQNQSKPFIKKDKEDLVDKLTDAEKRELRRYGYYDDEDYEDIFSGGDTSVINKVTVTIGGKKMNIEDKTKEPERKKPNPFMDDPGKEPDKKDLTIGGKDKTKNTGFESGKKSDRERTQRPMTVQMPS